jgi:hypothetical protein
VLFVHRLQRSVHRVLLEAEFSMSILTDDSGKAEQIEELRFTNDKFIWVDIADYDDYK